MPTSNQQGIQVRMRGDLTHTLKDGWRVSETSVTVEFLIPQDYGLDTTVELKHHATVLAAAQEQVYERLWREAGRREDAEHAG